ncbi:hypothetical protein HaLaN_14782, partial [Haematococcus lacustris]
MTRHQLKPGRPKLGTITVTIVTNELWWCGGSSSIICCGDGMTCFDAAWELDMGMRSSHHQAVSHRMRPHPDDVEIVS